MPKLIVIDGIDGSGKATQTALLAKCFENSRVVSFPNYESFSSSLVREYLSGSIDQDPAGVNAYAAASFYAADRYISYKTDWGSDYADGTTILCDRYTTSNAVHQMQKLPESQWDDFLGWLFDYEYEKLAIPKPDKVIYLDVLPEISASLIESRGRTKDIHENIDFLISSRNAALYAAKKQGWSVIKCYDDNGMLPIEAIHERILVDINL
jgi:Thymidylate kinase